MSYRHTQYGRLHWLFYALAAGLLVAAWFARVFPSLMFTLLFFAVLVACYSRCWRHLTIEDLGHSLSIRYGPAPPFGRQVFYADITHVEQDRTGFIDGWGINHVLFRGYTCNLWGFDCVKLRLSEGIVLRIGTDDAENLTTFLQSKISS